MDSGRPAGLLEMRIRHTAWCPKLGSGWLVPVSPSLPPCIAPQLGSGLDIANWKMENKLKLIALVCSLSPWKAVPAKERKKRTIGRTRAGGELSLYCFCDG